MCVCMCACVFIEEVVHACSVLSDCFVTPWTVARQAPLSWDSPGKNTGVGCHFLLQGIFLTQGSNPSHLCLLNWRVDSLQLHNLGSPLCVCMHVCVYVCLYVCVCSCVFVHAVFMYMCVHVCMCVCVCVSGVGFGIWAGKGRKVK